MTVKRMFVAMCKDGVTPRAIEACGKGHKAIQALSERTGWSVDAIREMRKEMIYSPRYTPAEPSAE